MRVILFYYMIHLNKHHYHYSTADLSAFETEHLFSLNVNRLIDKRIGMMIVWLKIARVAQKPWLSQGPNKHLYYLFAREKLYIIRKSLLFKQK